MPGLTLPDDDETLDRVVRNSSSIGVTTRAEAAQGLPQCEAVEGC